MNRNNSEHTDTKAVHSIGDLNAYRERHYRLSSWRR